MCALSNFTAWYMHIVLLTPLRNLSYLNPGLQKVETTSRQTHVVHKQLYMRLYVIGLRHAFVAFLKAQSLEQQSRDRRKQVPEYDGMLVQSTLLRLACLCDKLCMHSSGISNAVNMFAAACLC